MNEQQFISAARKAAADIRTKYILACEEHYFLSWVGIYKDALLKLCSHSAGILNAYRLFCNSPNNPKGSDFLEFKICAFVEALNEIEQKEIFIKSEENAQNPQPILPGFPKPNEL